MTILINYSDSCTPGTAAHERRAAPLEHDARLRVLAVEFSETISVLLLFSLRSSVLNRVTALPNVIYTFLVDDSDF